MYVTAMFSPEFTGQRAQMISRNHALILNTVIVSTKHLLHVCHCEQSSMFTKFYILFQDILSGCYKCCFWGGTVPFGKGLARTLVLWFDLNTACSANA